ncbi:MAG: hypothetical protein LBT80_06060 [Lactobacillaceae bacterium]|jgi:hypothetical protein|nr:hypothetical protein [Lactobacillaceae bacterium]
MMNSKNMKKMMAASLIGITLSATLAPSMVVLADGATKLTAGHVTSDVIENGDETPAADDTKPTVDTAKAAKYNWGEDLKPAVGLRDPKSFSLGDSLYFGTTKHQWNSHDTNPDAIEEQSRPILWDVINDKDGVYTLMSHYALVDGVEYDAKTAKFADSNLNTTLKSINDQAFSGVEANELVSSAVHSRQLTEAYSGESSVVGDDKQPKWSSDWNTKTQATYMYLPEMLDHTDQSDRVNLGPTADQKVEASLESPLFAYAGVKGETNGERAIWTRTPFSAYVSNSKVTSIPGEAMRITNKAGVVSDVKAKAGIRPIIQLKKADLLDLAPIKPTNNASDSDVVSDADAGNWREWSYAQNKNQHENYEATVVDAKSPKSVVTGNDQLLKDDEKLSGSNGKKVTLKATVPMLGRVAYKLVDAQTGKLVSRGRSNMNNRSDEQTVQLTLPSELPAAKYYQAYVWTEIGNDHGVVTTTHKASEPIIFDYKAEKDAEPVVPAPKQDDYDGQMEVSNLKADSKPVKAIYDASNYIAFDVQLFDSEHHALASGTFNNYAKEPNTFSALLVKNLKQVNQVATVDEKDTSKLHVDLRNIEIEPGVKNITLTLPAALNHFNKLFEIQIPVQQLNVKFAGDNTRNVAYTEDAKIKGLMHYQTEINVGKQLSEELAHNPSQYLSFDGAFADAKIDAATATEVGGHGVLNLKFSKGANFRYNTSNSNEGNIVFAESSLCYDDKERNNKKFKLPITDTYHPRVQWGQGLETTPSGVGSNDYANNTDVKVNGFNIARFTTYDTVQAFCRYEKEVIYGSNGELMRFRKGLTGFFPLLDVAFGLLDASGLFRKPQQDLRVDPVIEKLKTVERKLDMISDQIASFAAVGHDFEDAGEKTIIRDFKAQMDSFNEVNAASSETANTLGDGLQVTRLLNLVLSEAKDGEIKATDIPSELQRFVDERNSQVSAGQQITMEDMDLAFKKLYQLDKAGSVVQSVVASEGGTTNRSFMDKEYPKLLSAVASFKDFDNNHMTSVKAGSDSNIFDLFDQYMTKKYDFNNETFAERADFYESVGTQMTLLHLMYQTAIDYDYFTWETKKEKNEEIIASLQAEIGDNRADSTLAVADWNKAQSIILDAKAQIQSCTKPMKVDVNNETNEDSKFDALQTKLAAEKAGLKAEQDQFKTNNYLFSYRINKGINKVASEVSTTEVLHKLDHSYGIAETGEITNGQPQNTGLYGYGDQWLTNCDAVVPKSLSYDDLSILSAAALTRKQNLYDELATAGVQVENAHRQAEDISNRLYNSTGIYKLADTTSRILAGKVSHTGQVGAKNGRSSNWEYFTQGQFLARENGSMQEYKEHVKMGKYNAGSRLTPAVCELTVETIDQPYTMILKLADNAWTPALQANK